MAFLSNKESHTERNGTYRLTAVVEDEKRMVFRKRLEAVYHSLDEAIQAAFAFDKVIHYHKITITDDKNEEIFTLWGMSSEKKD